MLVTTAVHSAYQSLVDSRARFELRLPLLSVHRVVERSEAQPSCRRVRDSEVTVVADQSVEAADKLSRVESPVQDCLAKREGTRRKTATPRTSFCRRRSSTMTHSSSVRFATAVMALLGASHLASAAEVAIAW